MKAVARTFAGSLVGATIVFAGLATVAAHLGWTAAEGCPFTTAGLGFLLLAFFCEYVDSTLGMGYGTALTPLLMLLFGLEPLVVVPCILLSELVTGISAGVAHHMAGNVSFTRTSRASRVALVLSACSVLGAAAAVVVALNIPKVYLKVTIGVIVFSMGVFILAAAGRAFRFSWGRITGLGLLAAFNKGLSGGGYGPLITGGQILSGVEEKNAIGICSLSEGVTCVVGLTVYLLAGQSIAWELALPLMIGAFASVPVSAITVSRISARKLRMLIGILTVFLGMLTLVRLIV